MSQYNLIQNGESGLDVRTTLNDLLTAANSGFTSVYYQQNVNTFPSNGKSGDVLLVTNNGTSGGTVTEEWLYNGGGWGAVFTGATSGNLSGDYLPLSGGTVTGNTIFTSGLTTSNTTVNGNLTVTGTTNTGALTASTTTVNGNLTVTGTTSVSGLTASTLNLTAIGSGTSVTNLGISASGNIVSGNTIFEAFTGITRGRAVRLGENGKIYPMDFVGVENQPIVGIAQTSGVAGNLIQVAIEGDFSTTTTGLTPSYNYYASPNGSITLTGETYIGTALKSDTIQVWFGNPNGVITPSLSVIDNTITNPDDITTPGRYIVPVSGNTGVFVGEANDYADYDGSSFTFTIPTNGDKALITTGPNAGNVYLFTSGATSGWTLSSQSTTLPTSNWTLGSSYKQNDLVIYQNVLYQANGNIPANTAFVIGTSGLTWRQIGYGNVIPEYGSVYPTSDSTTNSSSDPSAFTAPLPEFLCALRPALFSSDFSLTRNLFFQLNYFIWIFF
jgi:hypothetical protein